MHATRYITPAVETALSFVIARRGGGICFDTLNTITSNVLNSMERTVIYNHCGWINFVQPESCRHLCQISLRY